MTPLEFNTLRKSLGFTHKVLAESFGVALRTAQRWCLHQTPPDAVANELLAMQGDWADRIAETLDTADALDSDPVLLFAYRDELECRTHTGLNLDQHAALLGHLCMALTVEDHAWEIQHKL